jgi:hypothetical protein
MELPLKEPEWVSTAPGIYRLANNLAQHVLIGVDTESNSLFAYQNRFV